MTDWELLYEQAFTEDVPDSPGIDMVGLRERITGGMLPIGGKPLTAADMDRLIDTVIPCDCGNCPQSVNRVK